MTEEEVRELVCELGYENSIVFENPSYHTAIIGFDDDGRVIYSYEKMIKFLVDTDNMTDEEAIEFIDYNTIRALPYAGEMHPIICFDTHFINMN